SPPRRGRRSYPQAHAHTPVATAKSAQATEYTGLGARRCARKSEKSAQQLGSKGFRRKLTGKQGRRGIGGKASCVTHHAGYYHRGIERRSDFRRRAVEKQRKSKDRDG